MNRSLSAAAAAVAMVALALGCSRADPSPSARRSDQLRPAAAQPTHLDARLLNADGQPIANVELGVLGERSQTTDTAGRVTLELSPWRAAAPVVYLRATLPGGDNLPATVPREAFAGALTLQLPAGTNSDRPLAIAQARPNPQVQAWFDVAAWQAARRERWNSASEPRAKLAVWAQVAAEIDSTSDPHVRALMIAAQFAIGTADPGAGLTREAAAAQALDELDLADPRWAIWAPSLPTAAFESGRWETLDQLDDQIRVHPQPEVAALITLERYGWAIREARWDQATAIWARWKGRPELHATVYGPIVESLGPTRRLAPGRMLPELCVDALDQNGRLCTTDFHGLTVLELYAIWCEGCRKSFPELAATVAAFEHTKPAPQLVTIEVYNDREQVRAFLAEAPTPGRHGWVDEGQREAVRSELGLHSVPTMLLVGPDGRILESSPQLRADNLERRIRHWQTTLGQ
ncbi:TlpA family protein disulfide reductase [Enhygromyxa salina]|nr:thioredoxin family protein [Enhygromyxa salina]